MEQNDIHEDIREYYRLWREIDMVYSRLARKLGISYYSLLTLHALWEYREHCSQKLICERWVLPKQTVNSILKEFEHQGYITFREMAEDRRNKQILLTDRGDRFARRIIGALFAVEENVMRRFSDERRAAMIADNRAYLEFLKEGMEGLDYEKEVF